MPVELKLIFAFVIASLLEAVNPVKVCVPELASWLRVPPRVQFPASALATVIVLGLSVVHTLSYWSLTSIIGWGFKSPPLLKGASGWVVSTIFVAAPWIKFWLTVASEYVEATILISLEVIPSCGIWRTFLPPEGIKLILFN